MPTIDQNELEEKSDLTSFIDIIFLLLIFFILTTKFVPDEMTISHLLPTNGSSSIPPPAIVPQEDISIVITPIGYNRSHSERDLHAQWNQQQSKTRLDAIVRIGGEQIRLSGNPVDDETNMSIMTEFISTELNKRVSTQKQPVVIHCFSGLPWRYALWAYDNVMVHDGDFITSIADSHAQDTREVAFAPPLLRNHTNHLQGRELAHLLCLR